MPRPRGGSFSPDREAPFESRELSTLYDPNGREMYPASPCLNKSVNKYQSSNSLSALVMNIWTLRYMIEDVKKGIPTRIILLRLNVFERLAGYEKGREAPRSSIILIP